VSGTAMWIAARKMESGGGPPQTKMRGVCWRRANCAKRRGVRQPSGAFGRRQNISLPLATPKPDEGGTELENLFDGFLQRCRADGDGDK